MNPLRVVPLVAVCVLGWEAPRLFAATEIVTVVKVMQNDDKGIVQRRNGERWMIEKGTGAISFWRYEGKTVLIDSPGTFCGAGSRVILPDEGQEARIWNAELLSSDVPRAAVEEPQANSTETVKAIARALVLLGYFDPNATNVEKKDPVKALGKLQAEHKVSETGRIGPRTLVKLSELLLREKGGDAESLALASVLLGAAKGLDKPAAPAGRLEETWIVSVSSDGSIVKLADGSVYEVDAVGQVKTMLWLPTQRVVRQADGLLNLQKGQKVRCTLLR